MAVQDRLSAPVGTMFIPWVSERKAYWCNPKHWGISVGNIKRRSWLGFYAVKYGDIDKTPSDGLCGKTDEDNLGFTYMQLDNYIMHGSSGDEDIDKVIAKKHTQNLHKLNPMPAYGSQP